MKRINIFWLLTFCCAVRGYGQGPTGINTKDPQQQLHVSGTTNSPGTPIGSSGIFTIKPTVRIDGLNKANNNAANGPYALPPLLAAPPYSWPSTASSLVQPVSVTQDGDMLLSNDFVIPLVATQVGADALSSTSISIPGNLGNNSLQQTLTAGTGYTFTLKQSCMVHFMASISVGIYKAGTAGSRVLLTDGINRLYEIHFGFTSVSFTNPTGNPLLSTSVTAGYQFGRDGNSYVNTSANGVSGNMYANPEAYLVLPPGTYTVDLFGRFFGYDFAFNAIAGSGIEDMVSIIATPLN